MRAKNINISFQTRAASSCWLFKLQQLLSVRGALGHHNVKMAVIKSCRFNERWWGLITSGKASQQQCFCRHFILCICDWSDLRWQPRCPERYETHKPEVCRIMTPQCLLSILQRVSIVQGTCSDVMPAFFPWVRWMPSGKLKTFFLFISRASLSFWCLVLTVRSTEVVCLAQGPNNIELAFPGWQSKLFTAFFSTLKPEHVEVSFRFCYKWP